MYIQLIFPKFMDQEPVTSSGPALECSPRWIYGLELKYGESEYLRAFLFLKAYSTFSIISYQVVAVDSTEQAGRTM
jgi:hypothetical protein